MNLVVCGLLTTLALVVCLVYDESLVFNMMMCVFCVLAITSLWSEQEPVKNVDSESNDVTQSTQTSKSE